MLVASMMLGGLLPVGPRTLERWAPSGAFRMPVGDPYQVYEDRPRTPGPFFIVRGVAWEGERASHQGADLGSGSAGALVRAAGAGVVVSVKDHGMHGGYGTHVVLAHRLPDGVLAYTVYAHLREYSPRVKAGQCVQAGQVLGRVGATGHATGPHLHFEVRVARDPEERWEFARVEDPLAFVDARLPAYRADTTGVEACLEWAECAGLVAPGARGEDALTREAWWRMIAAGVRGPALDPALAALDLRDSLVAARMVWAGANHAGGSPGQDIEWSELAHDLGRARALGVRTGPAPLPRSLHREVCEEALGTAAPSAHVSALIAREGRPTVAEAVMLFADLAGPAPPPAKPAAKKPAPVPTAGAIASAAADTTRRTRAPAKTTAHRDTVGTKSRRSSPAAGGSVATTASTKPGAKRAPVDSVARASIGTKAVKKSPKKATPSPTSGATATVTPVARPHAADSLRTRARRDTTHGVARRDTLRERPATPTASAADTAS